MKGKILTVLIGIIGVFLGIRDVSAQTDSTLNVDYVDNIYSYRYTNGVLMSYGKLPMRYQNNELAYCIEPNRAINVHSYTQTTDWSVTGYSSDVKRKMELISYYGYGYKNHNTIKYYMATQELIWLFSVDYVKWVDEFSTDGSLGNIINIEKEKNEILELVRKHDVLPSFNTRNYTVTFADTLNITDTNNVVDNYEIDNILTYTKNNSNLSFYVNKFGVTDIYFRLKANNNKTTTIFYTPGIDSQMMAIFGINEEKEARIKIKVYDVRVWINKKDINTNELIKDSNTTFKIVNKDTNQEYLKTTKDGYVYTALPKGKYELIEEKAPDGYIRNTGNVTFELNDDITLNNLMYTMDIYNITPKGKINIIKTDDEGNTLEGIKIGLYDEKYNKIDELITNKGINSFTNLKLGTYYIKELETLDGYVLDETPKKVELSYVDDSTSTIQKDIKIVNNKIKCNIIYITSSEELKLKDVEINVYDKDDKIVFTGKTNDDGKVIISDLPYGKYYIKQVKVPSGYILNKEEYVFYVNESTCQNKIEIENEKTIMPVTTTSVNKCLSIVLLLSSIGIYNFVKKSN